MKWTDEEIAFARTGRQSPRFIVQPADVRITEGEAVRFTAQAEGVPGPAYQWFSVDRTDNGQNFAGGNKSRTCRVKSSCLASRVTLSARLTAQEPLKVALRLSCP